MLHEFGLRFATLLLLPAAFYATTFVLHFVLLPHSGPGDKFHNLAFRCMFDGTLPPLPPPHRRRRRPPHRHRQRWSHRAPTSNAADLPLHHRLRPTAPPSTHTAPGPAVASPVELRSCTYKGCRPCEKQTPPSMWGAIKVRYIPLATRLSYGPLATTPP